MLYDAVQIETTIKKMLQGEKNERKNLFGIQRVAIFAVAIAQILTEEE